MDSAEFCFAIRDLQAYRQAQSRQRRGIKTAEPKCKQHIAQHIQNNNSRSMWSGIRTITSYKDATQPQVPKTISSLTALLILTGGRETLTSILHSTITLKHHQVRSNPQEWGEVPGRILKACTDQPVEVFTTIFKLLLELHYGWPPPAWRLPSLFLLPKNPQ